MIPYTATDLFAVMNASLALEPQTHPNHAPQTQPRRFLSCLNVLTSWWPRRLNQESASGCQAGV
jgi:hypothetical protein